MTTNPSFLYTKGISLKKSFNQINGECKDCTLHDNCKVNKTKLKKWLKSLGFKCKKGKILEVITEKDYPGDNNG